MFNWDISSKQKLFIWFLQFSIIISLLIYQQTERPIKLNANLLSLFETTSVNKIDKITKNIEAQNLNKHIILVGSDDLNDAINKASTLTSKLNELPLIETATVKFPPPPNLENIINDYLPFRHNFLSNKYKEILSDKNSSEIFVYQFSLLNQIANPAVSLSIKKDPTLSIADFFSHTLISNNGLSVVKNYLTTQYHQKHYVLVFFTPQKDSLDINATQQLTQSIKKLTDDNKTDYIYTGSIFYTSEASSSGQKEMLLYGGTSILATLILIVFAYRNFVTLLATATLIIISFLYGYLALSMVYDQMNIIALVFSVTLIGIAADYSFHALTELKYSQINANKKSPLKNIHSSLIMGYVTTGAGYALLLLAPFTLFQQIALFTLFGLFGALITALLCYPFLERFIGRGIEINSLKSIEKIHSIQKFLIQFVTRFWKIILLIFSLSLLFIAVKFNPENIRDYYEPDKTLKYMESQIKNILKAPWENQYFLIEGQTEQELLQNEEKLIDHLIPLLKTKDLAEYSAITTWLPSSRKQIQSSRLIRETYNSGHFSRMQKNLATANWQVRDDDITLQPKLWFTTHLGKLFKQQWIFDDNRYYSYVRLAGINNLSVLNSISKSLENVHFIDKAQQISNQMNQFKTHLVFILIAAFIAALLVFSWRYGIKTAALGLLTPVFSLIFALMFSYLFQQQLNIFNFIAGILILALGLDYSVFYAEHGFNKKITLTTLMSALSSTFVFAILIFSSMPAINSFGITVFIGIGLTFLFSPLVTLVQTKHPLV